MSTVNVDAECSRPDTGHEQVVFCQDQRQRPARDHRDLLHRAGPGARRHPLLPLRERGRGRSPTCSNLSRGMAYKNALAGLDHGGGKAVIIGDPRPRQDRGAAARVRPVRAVARRPLRHRLRRRHLRRRHGRRRPRVPLRHRPLARERRRRRLVRAHRVRRLPGHARLPPQHLWGDADAARAPGRRRGRRQGRPPPGASTCSRTAPRSSSPTSASRRVERVRATRTRRSTCRRHRRAGPRRPRRLRPVRARRRARRRDRRRVLQAAKIVCGAANNQLAHPGVEKVARRPRRSSTRPTTSSTPAA